MKSRVLLFSRVLGSLFLLLVLTTLLAFLPLQPWNWIIAVAISLAMTLLILLFFMKLRQSEPLIWLTSASGFIWLSILIILVMLDVLSRPWPR